MLFCPKCGKTLDEKNFYISKRIDKYPPEGRMNLCKNCLTMHVDNWNPETFKPILEEVDVPYIKEEWDKLLEKWGDNPRKMKGTTIIGRYLAKMKLIQFNKYHWNDTEELARKSTELKIDSMKMQGLTDEEIQEQLSIDRTPKKPIELIQQEEVQTLNRDEEFEIVDEFEDKLTEEDKTMLRLKWGKGYRAEEWIKMEQLYDAMMNSYDIQSAGHKDTLIMICKTSLKTNQLLDAGDIDGAQKMSKMYDSLMKSGNFTAAQNKGESGDFIDSIGELVAICEKEGFIPRYYVDEPKDKVDKVLLDLQHYTQTLVREEMNLGNMIDASLRAITQDKEREANINIDSASNEDKLDAMLAYPEEKELTIDDYQEFEDMKEQDRQLDQEDDELWPQKTY